MRDAGASGVASIGAGGGRVPLDSEKNVKNWGKEGKNRGKRAEKSGKNCEK